VPLDIVGPFMKVIIFCWYVFLFILELYSLLFTNLYYVRPECELSSLTSFPLALYQCVVLTGYKNKHCTSQIIANDNLQLVMQPVGRQEFNEMGKRI
jgi:hypothetical protein